MPRINIAIDPSGAIRGAAKVNKALGSIGSKAGSIIKTAFNPFNAALATIGGGAAAVGLAKVGDQFTIMAAQLEYATGSAQGAAFAEEDLYDTSRKTGTQIEANAGTYVKLQQAQKMTGLTSAENIKVIGALNTLMIKTGTSGVQASASMLQLSQALTSGKLSGDEFRSMAENAPGVLNKMSEAMGIAREDLKQMSTDGELTSERLGAALLSIAESGEESFDTLPKTAAKGWNSVVLAFQEAWDKINDKTGILGKVHDGLEGLADWIEDNSYRFVTWADDLVLTLQENWPIILDYITKLWQSMKIAGLEIYSAVSSMVANLGGVVNIVTTLVNWVNKAISAIGALASQLSVGSTFAKFVDRATLGVISGTAAAAGTLAGGGGMGDAIDAYGEAASAGIAGESGSNITNTINITTPVNKNVVRDITSEQGRQGALI